jgi:hypothetical protein
MEVPSDLEPDSAEEQKESNYVCLTPNDILREQQEEINKISELFEVRLEFDFLPSSSTSILFLFDLKKIQNQSN